MTRFLVVWPIVALAIFSTSGSLAQANPTANSSLHYAAIPLKDAKASMPAVRQQSASGSTIPLWSYSVVSPLDGNTYDGQMVGRSAFYHGQRSTTIPVYLVPVVITFADSGEVFDPTAPDPCLSNDTVLSTVQQSPLFNSTNYVMNGVTTGNTQYVDAFQRANFWTNVSVAGDSYHVLLDVKTAATQSVTVPTSEGYSAILNCPYGTMNLTWWDNYVRSTLLPALASDGVGTTSFPIFILDSVRTYVPNNNFIFYGYHSAFMPSGVLQTYAVSEFNTAGIDDADVANLSHEIAEWMNDPLVTNITPAWGHVGEVSGCQANLEIADPLTGTYIEVPLNGFNYHVQELAFFSWFYRQAPSIGAGGLYSDNGTMTSGAGPVCM